MCTGLVSGFWRRSDTASCACSGWPTDPDVPSTPALAAAVLAVYAVRAGHGTVDRVGLAIMRARSVWSSGCVCVSEYVERTSTASSHAALSNGQCVTTALCHEGKRPA